MLPKNPGYPIPRALSELSPGGLAGNEASLQGRARFGIGLSKGSERHCWYRLLPIPLNPGLTDTR